MSKNSLLIKNKLGKLTKYDPFNYNLNNQNAFIFGPFNQARESFSYNLIKQRILSGNIVYIIDNDGKYSDITKNLGGHCIEYKNNDPFPINPFSLYEKYGSNFLIKFLGKIWKDNLKELTNVEFSILLTIINEYFDSCTYNKNIKNFYEWLKNYITQNSKYSKSFDLENFLHKLQPFVNGIHENVFHSSHTSLNYETKKIIYFNLENITYKYYNLLHSLILNIIFEYIQKKFYYDPKPKTFIDIEDSLAITNETTQAYIKTFMKDARKNNISVRITCSNLKDIQGSKLINYIYNFSYTFILFRNNDKAIDYISSCLDLTDLEKSKYKNLSNTELFIKEMQNSLVYQV